MQKITLDSYIFGLVLSAAFTLFAFDLVAGHVFEASIVKILLVVLAVLQLGAQLVFFMHMGKESGPRWNLTVLAFAVLIVGILVSGTLWIMNNLKHNESKRPDTVLEQLNVSPQLQKD